MLLEHQVALAVAGDTSPTAAATDTRQTAIVAGRYIASLERTISHSQMAATNVPAVRNDPATACVNPAIAVLFVNSATTIATIQMRAKCRSRGSRPQPKIHSPINVDSKKNAIKPSRASGAPKMWPM
jgi:hypothetical protein